MRGWHVSGTIFARTGFPYTVFDSAESAKLAKGNYFLGIYATPIVRLKSGVSRGKAAAFPTAAHPCQQPQFLGDGITPNANAHFIQAGCETGFNSGNLGQSGVCDGPAVSFSQGREALG